MEMIMNFTPEQIASTNKAGIEAILGLAHTQFAAFDACPRCISCQQGRIRRRRRPTPKRCSTPRTPRNTST